MTPLSLTSYNDITMEVRIFLYITLIHLIEFVLTTFGDAVNGSETFKSFLRRPFAAEAFAGGVFSSWPGV